MGVVQNLRGLVSSLLGKNKDFKSSSVNLVDLFTPYFSSSKYSQKFNDTFMSGVNAHARHVSKAKPMVYLNDKPSNQFKYLNRILNLRPNPIMNAPTFYETIGRNYFTENNVFIFLEWDYSNIKEPLKYLWVLDPDSVEIKKGSDNTLYFKFTIDGEQKYTSIENIVHIARDVSVSDLFGESNRAIDQVLKIIQTNYEGIEQAIKVSAYIRFIVRSSTVLNTKVKKERAEEFAKNFLSKDNTSGIIYVDGVEDLQKIESSAKYMDYEMLEHLDKKIYRYLGISEKIVEANFNEDEWQGYFESSIEPLFLKLQTELTYKIFTKREQELGNHIIIDSNRLQNASLKTRVAIAKIIQSLPVYRPNDVNDLLFLPKTEHGNKEYGNLNFVNADKQSAYQGVSDKEEES